MKFHIARVSDWMEKSKPCDKAYREGDEWFIEISSLAALMDLISEVDCPLIVDEKSVLNKIAKIKIYDDYNE